MLSCTSVTSTLQYTAGLPAKQAVQICLQRQQHSQAVKDAFAACASTVQTHDPENHQWAKALPTSYRAPVMMLRALNVETSMIGDLVTAGGSGLRQMRFSWWQDSIDKTFAGTEVQHPVLTALGYTLQVAPLSKYRLQKLVAAKEADQVEHQAPATLAELGDFAEATQSNLLYLQLEAAGIKNADADHAASHYGKAIGLASLLRGTVHFLQRGICYLPLDLCAQQGVATERLYRGEGLDNDAVREVVFQVATEANAQLRQAEQLHGESHKVPADAKPLFQASVATRLYLQALERCHFNVTDRRLAHGGFSPLWYTLQLQLARSRA